MTLQSKGIVRNVIEKNGQLLVSFPSHDGYFHVPLGNAELCARIIESRDKKTELSFTFDRDLQILSIQ